MDDRPDTEEGVIPRLTVAVVGKTLRDVLEIAL